MAEGKRKRRWGDRNDGRRLRTVSPYIAITPYIMRTRNDACNLFTDSIEVTQTDRYLRRKRLEGMKGLGMLHLFIAAYCRAVSQYPSINRFVNGRRLFARNNIEIVMTIKRAMLASAPETSIKVVLSPADTLQQVYEKMEAAISHVKNDGNTSTDDVAKSFMKLPRFFLNFLVALLRFLDYFFGLPRALLNASPFHGSMILTDIGSLGIPPIYHHIYNFGNLPIFVSFGAKYRRAEMDRDSQLVERKYVDFTVVTDERITDGFNYAAAFKLMRRCVNNPVLLETPPEAVVEDID